LGSRPLEMADLPLDDLDDTEFEEFCFGALREIGFVNLDWRKGTGLATSPADRGRDIVGQLERTDVDGVKHFETWFVDCKHYKRGVPPEKLQSLLAWAQAERPHTALFIASNFLSNPAKDFLKDYEANNRPPFRIKYWERPTLERLVEGHDEFLQRFLLGGIRSEAEIVAAEQEFHDRVWYERKLMIEARIAEGRETLSPEVLNLMRDAMRQVEERYRKENLAPNDDFKWGMLSGKLSALRWVLGEEWDFLDT
jgi:hypothetical protein